MIAGKQLIGPSRAAMRLSRAKNIFEELELKRHDEDYTPKPCRTPCEHAPGSVGKIEELRMRVLRGEELFHPMDVVVVATIEQQNAASQWMTDTIVNGSGTAKHIQERRDRQAEIDKYANSPDYVTIAQLRVEMKASGRTVWRYLKKQNPRYVQLSGTKYFLRSSLAKY